MDSVRTDPLQPGWVQGWMVLRTKETLPGDFVSIHAHAEDAQAEARQRGHGHQVFHGRRSEATGEFIVD